MSATVKKYRWMAQAFVGWPDCACGASDYRVVRTEGLVQWVEPTGVIVPERKWCRHRPIELALLRAYRAGRKAAHATR